MSKGKFAFGALLGAAAGVVAGFLTAPKSGKETRADLKAKAEELKSEGEKKAAEVKKQGEKLYDEGKKTVDDYRGRAERAVEAAKGEFVDDNKKKS
ncbi:MAG TPA: YtxH domain-containing protein [Candidatus Saccharimonas sp.]|jgi:gas vesicle protein|nr:YtxH domain-containing protein [Candidatus Saccharimonas sp.]